MDRGARRVLAAHEHLAYAEKHGGEEFYVRREAFQCVRVRVLDDSAMQGHRVVSTWVHMHRRTHVSSSALLQNHQDEYVPGLTQLGVHCQNTHEYGACQRDEV